jgi:ATP-dependent DNA helicase RecG
VGPARRAALAEAGYTTAEDLLWHLPQRWEDRRRLSTVEEARAAAAGTRLTLHGRLCGLRSLRTRRRGLTLVRGRFEDAAGALPVVWFNRPWLARQLPDGTEVVLHGEVREARGGGRELLNPSCERVGGEAEGRPSGARVVPVYPAVGNLGPAWMGRLLDNLLAAVDPRRLPEPLPRELLLRRGLPTLGEALHQLHRPGEEADTGLLESRRSPAHLRLLYGELLELQLELALVRERQVRIEQGFRYRVDDRVRRVAREVLPFRLTGAQRRVLQEIVGELARPTPMLRLLQGDVGSGKTIVAALALVVALESGLQGAFMVPTELLAEQHYASLRRLLGGRYRVGLLSGSAAEGERLRRELARGELQLAVGTHALIQQDVRFRRLGLVVIDEQHRFGVEQRRILSAKGERPDVLVMTATPIPRSLALSAYGDLELSVLDELPPGRTPVATEVLPAGRRRQVWARLERALDGGAQAYAVFPLIEDSDQVAAESVEGRGEELRRRLGRFPSAVLHGRVPAAEREAVMAAFAAGEIRLQVATTVIEVGVDVPGATWMLIDSAERFGLAQLHQLRGRVGRGSRPSRCVALHGRLTPEAQQRLTAFAATTDGFALAEADLAQRGPGELLGTRQAGLPSFRVAELPRDLDWLMKAREDARRLLPRLGEPTCEALRRRLEPRVARRLEGWGGG